MTEFLRNISFGSRHLRQNFAQTLGYEPNSLTPNIFERFNTLGLDSNNSIDSRINITSTRHVWTVHQSSSVLHILKSLLNLKCYKVRYIALAILRAKKFKISDA